MRNSSRAQCRGDQRESLFFINAQISIAKKKKEKRKKPISEILIRPTMEQCNTHVDKRKREPTSRQQCVAYAYRYFILII